MLRSLLKKGLASLPGLPWLVLPAPAHAHAFGKAQVLPVPLWLYLYGSVLALLSSVVVIGLFAGLQHAHPGKHRHFTLILNSVSRCVVWIAQALALLLLILCIGTGFTAKQNPYLNFNMTFFWIIFFLGCSYLVPVLGNFYAVLNPWMTLTRIAEPLKPRLFDGQAAYPKRLQHYPALALYIAFVWIELFGTNTPRSLSIALLCYTGLTLLCCWLWGKSVWLEHGEFFGVFFGTLAKLSPFSMSGRDGRRIEVKLHTPLERILRHEFFDLSQLVLVLFMLSATAFDGLKETIIWEQVSWKGFIQPLAPLFGNNLAALYPLLQKLQLSFNTIAMFVLLGLYLAAYLSAILVMKWITRCRLPALKLTYAFALTLVPIVFAYNFAHYFTLLCTQGLQIFFLANDPLNLGWHLFRFTHLPPPAWLTSFSNIWHIQVIAIVAGHIASVYLAHVKALQLFTSRKMALLSQLPILALMVVYTWSGLWILAQPISRNSLF